jgi:plastocyanin
MGKQIVNRTKKILGVLLIAFFVLSVTAVAANAKISGGGKIVDVAMKNSAFSPMSVKISVGDNYKMDKYGLR